MPISDWLSARDKRRYTQLPEGSAPSGSVDMPDGVWFKCEECKHTLYEGELVQNLRVCRHCGHHFDLTAPQRIAMIADEGSFGEIHGDLVSADPLEFVAAKSYRTSLEGARAKSDLPEAVIVGHATIGGVPVVLGAMDFRFIGASMGSVVGEKVARAFELTTAESMPIVLVIASGGARMQEGMLSLMQMAKTSAAARRHADAGLAYVSVLTNPTYGGVTASFAVLADVIVAEPGAVIGFAGPRVIEQTIRQKLPKGFRTAEYMLEHGMVDEVVPRSELTERIALLLGYLQPRVAAGGEV
jgi:acetyl-CoA carboxylase carboxyl transferase subunit beta